MSCDVTSVCSTPTGGPALPCATEEGYVFPWPALVPRLLLDFEEGRHAFDDAVTGTRGLRCSNFVSGTRPKLQELWRGLPSSSCPPCPRSCYVLVPENVAPVTSRAGSCYTHHPDTQSLRLEHFSADHADFQRVGLGRHHSAEPL